MSEFHPFIREIRDFRRMKADIQPYRQETLLIAVAGVSFKSPSVWWNCLKKYGESLKRKKIQRVMILHFKIYKRGKNESK